MKIVFATTSTRKLDDIKKIILKNNFDIQILTLDDIGWNLGEIEENGTSLEENSQIKALEVHNFCLQKGLDYIVLADDAGLFVEALNGEPGIYTARYADLEIENNPSLPKYECVNKLLGKMENANNRNAYYSCSVAGVYPNGEIIQAEAFTKGEIAKQINEPIVKPYFYTVFIPEGYKKTFNNLSDEELYNTYRFIAIEKILNRILKREPIKLLE